MTRKNVRTFFYQIFLEVDVSVKKGYIEAIFVCSQSEFIERIQIIPVQTCSNIKESFISVLTGDTYPGEFLNGIIHLPFLELSIIIFGDSKMRT